MFRLTRVIFRLELYLFTLSLCSFWDPRRLHVFSIDVIYCITVGGCNKCHCYGIVTKTFVTNSNCYKIYNICKKHVNIWDPGMSTVTM